MIETLDDYTPPQTGLPHWWGLRYVSIRVNFGNYKYKIRKTLNYLIRTLFALSNGDPPPEFKSVEVAVDAVKTVSECTREPEIDDQRKDVEEVTKNNVKESEMENQLAERDVTKASEASEGNSDLDVNEGIGIEMIIAAALTSDTSPKTDKPSWWYLRYASHDSSALNISSNVIHQIIKQILRIRF